MATLTTSTTLSDRPGALRRAVSALWTGMLRLSEYGPMMDEVHRLNSTSDRDLAARGTTREDEIRRIFGPRMGF